MPWRIQTYSVASPLSDATMLDDGKLDGFLVLPSFALTVAVEGPQLGTHLALARLKFVFEFAKGDEVTMALPSGFALAACAE